MEYSKKALECCTREKELLAEELNTCAYSATTYKEYERCRHKAAERVAKSARQCLIE